MPITDKLEPPEELFSKIMNRIQKEQRITARRRLILYFMMLTGSILAIPPLYQVLRQAMVESGFVDFLMLIFSDTEIVMAYRQNFILSVLEALPIMSLAAFLATILIFLESLRLLMRDLQRTPRIFKLNRHSQLIK